jgi:hypothetical protein
VCVLVVKVISFRSTVPNAIPSRAVNTSPRIILTINVAPETRTLEQAFDMCHHLARAEGLCVGGSGGLNVTAALQVADKLTSPGVVVTVLPDLGVKYLSKVYSPEWLLANGIVPLPEGMYLSMYLCIYASMFQSVYESMRQCFYPSMYLCIREYLCRLLIPEKILKVRF